MPPSRLDPHGSDGRSSYGLRLKSHQRPVVHQWFLKPVYNAWPTTVSIHYLLNPSLSPHLKIHTPATARPGRTPSGSSSESLLTRYIAPTRSTCSGYIVLVDQGSFYSNQLFMHFLADTQNCILSNIIKVLIRSKISCSTIYLALPDLINYLTIYPLSGCTLAGLTNSFTNINPCKNVNQVFWSINDFPLHTKTCWTIFLQTFKLDPQATAIFSNRCFTCSI